MIILLLMTAIAQEPTEIEHDNRADRLYKTFCVSCHGERNEKTPYLVDNTAEEKTKAIKRGKESMPGYSWLLSDTDIADLISYMDSLKTE